MNCMKKESLRRFESVFEANEVFDIKKMKP